MIRRLVLLLALAGLAACGPRKSPGMRDDPMRHYEMGTEHLRQGRPDRAAVALERAVALDPEAPFPHLCLGALYMEFLGDPRLATQHLRRYQELGGDDPRAAEWLRRRVR